MVGLAPLEGCLWGQQQELLQAREAYDACVAENLETARRSCAELKAQAEASQERYEDDARRTWGCGGDTRATCDPQDRVGGTRPER